MHDKAASKMLVPVILCGGAGSRLWPLSRKDFAKQHVAILDGPSLFQRTLRIAEGPFAMPIAITPRARGSWSPTRRRGGQLEIALEPEGRDTLAAMTTAACLAARRDPEAVVLVMPSDHFIPDAEAFAGVVAAAASLAEAGRIVTIGLTPTAPAAGYGYIGAARRSGRVPTRSRFIEKPDAARAAELIGRAVSGMPASSASAPTACCARSANFPDGLDAVQRAIAEGDDDLGALGSGTPSALRRKSASTTR